MTTMLMIMMTPIILTMIMALLIKSSKRPSSNQSPLPFECGFGNTYSINLPFSIPFFMITFLFLIFDVELSLLISSIPNINNINPQFSIIMISFSLLMLISMIYEIDLSCLTWIK